MYKGLNKEIEFYLFFYNYRGKAKEKINLTK